MWHLYSSSIIGLLSRCLADYGSPRTDALAFCGALDRALIRHEKFLNETRGPCCRSEPPRDAGHLCRKLAPNPLATQWIEISLKLPSEWKAWGSCRKTTLEVHQWMTDACCRMVSRDPRAKVHKIRGISFDWPDPHSCKTSPHSDKKCARHRLWKNVAVRKSRQKFTLITRFLTNR